DGFIQGDYLGRFITCNEKTVQLTGYTKEELRSKTIFDLFTSGALKQNPLRFDLLTPRKTMINEREIIRKDGTKITVEMSTSMMPDGTYQSFFRDITDRKLAEEAIRKSEGQYRDLFERANDAILIFEPETEIIMDANQTACQVYGFSKEELVGMSIKAISRNVKRGEEHVRKLLDKGRYEEFETQQLRKDGTVLHLLINASVIEYNGRKAILTINRDITERKKAEDKLRLLSQTVKSVSQGVSVTDLNNNIIFINQAFLDVYGYTEEELIGKHISIVNADPKPQYRAIIDATVHQGWHGELINRRKDGTLFPIYLHTSAVLDENKEPIGLVGVMSDITENKRAEMELADKNKNLQFLNSLAVELTDFPIDNDLEQFLLSRISKFTGAELAVYGGYEYSDNTLSVRHFSSRSESLMEAYYTKRNHSSSVDWNIYNALISQTIRKHSILDNISSGLISPIVKERICEAGGLWYFYEISFVAAGRFFGAALLGFTEADHIPPEGLLNSFANLAAVSLSRRYTEFKLKESEEQFRTIFENAVLGIYRTTPDGRIEKINKALCRMLGYSSEADLLDVNLENGEFHPSYERSIFKERVNSDNYITLESTWKKSDGSTISVRENARAIRNINGDIIYFDGTVEDITAQKEAQEEILKINQKLKELNATKDKLFSIIAHDLRGPFSGILGLSELLANNMESLDENEIQRCTRVLHSTSQRLYQLLTNLLEWSRIQTGKLEFKPTELFVFDEVENIKQIFAPNATRKEISLINSIDREITVNADAHYFSTIMRNLISNAIKFTKQNGTITISSHVNGNGLELSVSDTGVGMSDDIINKIFRIDTAHTMRGTNNEQGTGLGLVLCKELIEKSGGSISVKSTPGEGSTFTICLPK
ncbi:MAG: PAS domain S-box protein, partial [Syntrophothermus sp.]